jgi:DNA-binding NtrC family response regulator
VTRRADDPTQARTSDPSPQSLQLTVVGQTGFLAYPLPPSGTLTIGRGSDADVRVDDGRISRKHALLHVGDELAIEDLGSANGTQLGETRLSPGVRTPIAPGDAIQIGDHIVVVQRAEQGRGPRRVWSHDYFETRLHEECARAEATGSRFGVARFRLKAPATRTQALETLSGTVGAADIVASYGPADYEVLLARPSEPPTETAARVLTSLATRGISAQGVAVSCPADGRTADALLARLSTLLRGTGREIPTEPDGSIDSPRMREVRSAAERAAAGNINVLILGETGVGKDVLARYVHRVSRRASKPFLRLNCAALAENLLESELFGHEKGAFTGAQQAKPGLLETAEGGTVFLDEVGELPLAIQAKLLQVIETREVLRLGSVRGRTIDVRFVAATNRDLEREVENGKFRQDLYFRLNGFTVLVPPLRDRVEEILPLALRFLGEAARQAGASRIPFLSDEAVTLLTQYAWPGNVRELRNVIERAVLLCADDAIAARHLPAEKMGRPTSMLPPPVASDATPPEIPVPTTDERERILRVLASCGGNQSQAARILGIARNTLLARLEAYGVPRPRKRADPPA